MILPPRYFAGEKKGKKRGGGRSLEILTFCTSPKERREGIRVPQKGGGSLIVLPSLLSGYGGKEKKRGAECV